MKKQEVRYNQSVQTLLFVMPNDAEMTIAAVAAVEAYVISLVAQRVRVRVAIVISGFFIFQYVVFPPQWLIFNNVGKAVEVMGRFDLAVGFDIDDAREISKNVEQSAATCFALKLGIPGVKELPRRIVKAPEIEYNVGIVDTKYVDCSKLHEMVSRDNSLKVKRVKGIEALSCEVVIGEPSVYTYLATMMGRAVIEIIPKSHGHFLDKWSSSRWYKYEVDTENVNEEEVIRLTLFRSFERIKGLEVRTKL